MSDSLMLERMKAVEALKRSNIEEAQQEVIDLWSWSGQTHPQRALQQFREGVRERCNHVPFAYITGMHPFYHRNFIVNSHTLIPRPETETLVGHVLEVLKSTTGPLTVVDCGTGCGAIAITLKAELPQLRVIATDCDQAAIAVARKNAEVYAARVEFFCGDLLTPLNDQRINVVVANLPYLPDSWADTLAPELHYEPPNALYASSDDGLAIIKRLIRQIRACLEPPRWLWLELLPFQLPILQHWMKSLGITAQTLPDITGVHRYLRCEWPPSLL